MDSDEEIENIFGNRANKIMKSTQEAFEKFKTEKHVEEDEEEETDILGKIKKKLKKRTVGKKGRQAKKPKPEPEMSADDDPEDRDSLNEDNDEEPQSTPPATRKSARRTRRAVDLDVGDLELPANCTPVNIPIKAKRRLKELKLKTDREAAQIDEAVKRTLSSCDKDFLEASEITSLIELERTITLKIRYLSEITKITVLETEKFTSIFNKVADLYQLKASEILLCLDDQNIQLEDTPLSLKLKIYDVIDCIPFKATEEFGDKKDDPNSLVIKFQSSDSKKKIEMNIHKLEKFKDYMEKYAQMRDIRLSDLTFEFDGDTIQDSETPEDLDMESGSCIDVRIAKIALPQEKDDDLSIEYVAPIPKNKMINVCVID